MEKVLPSDGFFSKIFILKFLQLREIQIDANFIKIININNGFSKEKNGKCLKYKFTYAKK